MVHIQRKPRTEYPDTPDSAATAKSGLLSPAKSEQAEDAANSVAAGGEKKEDKEESAPLHLCCPISGELLEDPVVISSGHTYSRKDLEAFLEVHRVPTGSDEDDEAMPLMFLDEAIPVHDCVAKAAEKDGGGGGSGVTALMKGQVYTNLLALAAVDEFNSKMNDSGRFGRNRSSTRHLLSNAEIDHYTDDDEVAYLLDPITYELLEEPVCTRYGHTYSRDIVQECIQRRKEDPTCCLPLEANEIVPNLLAKFLIQQNESANQ